jgi:poly(3-hydroxybutyrate) depolymerase
MRIRLIVAATAAASLSAGFAAVAQTSYELARDGTIPVERIYVKPLNQPFGPYHGGYVTYRDGQVLSDAIAVLDAARNMNGAVVTMVVDNGRMTVNGNATLSQAARIQNMLSRVDGVTRVTAWFDSSGS